MIPLNVRFHVQTLVEFIALYASNYEQNCFFIASRQLISAGTRVQFTFKYLDESLIFSGIGTVVRVRYLKGGNQDFGSNLTTFHQKQCSY